MNVVSVGRAREAQPWDTLVVPLGPNIRVKCVAVRNEDTGFLLYSVCLGRTTAVKSNGYVDYSDVLPVGVIQQPGVYQAGALLCGDLKTDLDHPAVLIRIDAAEVGDFVYAAVGYER